LSDALITGAPDIRQMNVSTSASWSGQVALPVVLSGLLCVGLLAIQVLEGTSLPVAVLLVLALWFGCAAVSVGGGVRSTRGVLNAILLVKTIGLGLLLKAFFLEPADTNLASPEITSLVMCAGFASVLAGTILARALPTVRTPLCSSALTANVYGTLAAIVVISGYAGWTIAAFAEWGSAYSEGVSIGGVLGYARQFADIKDFGVAVTILWLWKSNAKRCLTHPLVVFLIALGIATGVIGASKQVALNAIAYAALTYYVIYGVRSVSAWLTVAAGALALFTIIYPFAQYARGAGAREGSTKERLEFVYKTFVDMATDSSYRRVRSTEATSFLDGNPDLYLDHSLGPVDRFIMIGPADELIAATTQKNQFTGSETIVWGFKMLPPRFLYPNKPAWAPNNYLASIVGALGAEDRTTQISYGFMANFYNAYAIPGVLIGTFAFVAFMHWWLTLFIGNDSEKSVWFIFAIGQLHHGLAEWAFAGLLVSVVFLPLFVVALRGSAVHLARRPTRSVLAA
jgi:hypothetical protein